MWQRHVLGQQPDSMCSLGRDGALMGWDPYPQEPLSNAGGAAALHSVLNLQGQSCSCALPSAPHPRQSVCCSDFCLCRWPKLECQISPLLLLGCCKTSVLSSFCLLRCTALRCTRTET